MIASLLSAVLLAAAGPEGPRGVTDPASPGALDAYESALRTPAHLQPMSYGGGLEWTFEADSEPGCRLYVREYGREDAEPWIVVHGGFGAEHSYLLDAFAGLERDVRLIFYDQRGSLRSHCPVERVTRDAHVRDIERLRVVLGLERINLVGHSMGTHIASRYVEIYGGETADRVVLLAPGLLRWPLQDADIAANPDAANFNGAGEARLSRGDVAARIEAEGFNAEGLGPREKDLRWRLGFTGVNNHSINHWREFRGGGAFYSGEAGNAAIQSIAEYWDMVPVLKGHSGRVSVIIGDDDFIDLGAGLAHHWFGDDTHVSLTVLENAGHNAWLDQPREFRTALVEAMLK